MAQETNEKRRLRLSAVDWIEGIKSEFKRVSWTSKEELVAYTKMVVVATFLSGFTVYAVDLIIQKTLALIGLTF